MTAAERARRFGAWLIRALGVLSLVLIVSYGAFQVGWKLTGPHYHFDPAGHFACEAQWHQACN
jgi:hypothetical protein